MKLLAGWEQQKNSVVYKFDTRYKVLYDVTRSEGPGDSTLYHLVVRTFAPSLNSVYFRGTVPEEDIARIVWRAMVAVSPNKNMTLEACALKPEFKAALASARTKDELYDIAAGAPWGLCQDVAAAFKRVDPSGRVVSIQGNFGREISPHKIDSSSTHVIYIDSNDRVWDPMFHMKNVDITSYLKRFNITMRKESMAQKLHNLQEQIRREDAWDSMKADIQSAAKSGQSYDKILSMVYSKYGELFDDSIEVKQLVRDAIARKGESIQSSVVDIAKTMKRQGKSDEEIEKYVASQLKDYEQVEKVMNMIESKIHKLHEHICKERTSTYYIPVNDADSAAKDLKKIGAKILLMYDGPGGSEEIKIQLDDSNKTKLAQWMKKVGFDESPEEFKESSKLDKLHESVHTEAVGDKQKINKIMGDAWVSVKRHIDMINVEDFVIKGQIMSMLYETFDKIDDMIARRIKESVKSEAISQPELVRKIAQLHSDLRQTLSNEPKKLDEVKKLIVGLLDLIEMEESAKSEAVDFNKYNRAIEDLRAALRDSKNKDEAEKLLAQLTNLMRKSESVTNKTENEKEGVMDGYIQKAEEYLKKYPTLSVEELKKIVFKDYGQNSLEAAGIWDMIRTKKKNKKEALSTYHQNLLAVAKKEGDFKYHVQKLRDAKTLGEKTKYGPIVRAFLHEQGYSMVPKGADEIIAWLDSKNL